jgi:guanine nucleotide-binding protein subunit alpha, other
MHLGGFPKDERIQAKAVIYSNVVVAFKMLLEITRDKKIDFAEEMTGFYSAVLQDAETVVDSDQVFRDARVKQAMLALWSNRAVQRAITESQEFILNETLAFYFQGTIRIFDPYWLPTDEDMLHARLKTTGITETVFELKQLTFRMMDVGGQRSERKKWIHCFEGVHCLLFVASLSGYDQCLVEDINANQMHESLVLFDSLVHSEWFKDKPIILFLNKLDLFRKKLAVSPLSVFFPDYRGKDSDEGAAKSFFAAKFKAVDDSREIYVHYTNATDTSLLETTMEDVQDMLVRRNLQSLLT